MTEGREQHPGPLSGAAESDRPALDPVAREELITSNLGLAHQLARRFLHRGEPIDDLVQVASVALVKSVDNPDETVLSPATVSGLIRSWSFDAGKNDATLTPPLAEATGATEEAVIEAIEAGQGYRAASIDASESEEDPLSARLDEEDGNFGSVEDRALLGPALATLPEREQAILRMRFVEGLTQSEIAAAVGVSQMHVSRLLSSSLEKLREGIGQAEAGRR